MPRTTGSRMKWSSSWQARLTVAGMQATITNSSPDSKPMTDLTRQEVDAKLAASEAKVDARLANFDTSIKTGFADMRIEMVKLQAEMHKNTADLIRWAIGLALAIIGATVGLLTYINKATEKQSTPLSMSQPPIVITVPGAAAAPAQTPKP